MLDNILVILGKSVDPTFDLDVNQVIGKALYNDETGKLELDFSDERTKFIFEEGLDREKPVVVAVYISVLGRPSEAEKKRIKKIIKS